MAYTYDSAAVPMSAKDQVRLLCRDNTGADSHVFEDGEITQFLTLCDSDVRLAAAMACRARAAREADSRAGVRLGAYSDSAGATTDWNALADKYEADAYARAGAAGSGTVEVAADDFGYQELQRNKSLRGESD
jgi:hypothetical protein